MASILKVDTITGIATAGSIAITGEGNSTTTNLQQGLAKAWVKLNQTDGTATDSFNVAGVSDDGTALGSYTFTNNMNNDTYCLSAMGGKNDYIQCNTVRTDATPDSTSGVSSLLNGNYNGANNDTKQMNSVVYGDLA
jgi:hypothetical protein